MAASKDCSFSAHIATRSLLVSGASQALHVCIVLTVALCAPSRVPNQANG